jgi:hypothetical protein
MHDEKAITPERALLGSRHDSRRLKSATVVAYLGNEASIGTPAVNDQYGAAGVLHAVCQGFAAGELERAYIVSAEPRSCKIGNELAGTARTIGRTGKAPL